MAKLFYDHIVRYFGIPDCNGQYRGVFQYKSLQEPGLYLYYTASAMPVAEQQHHQFICMMPWVTSIMLCSFLINPGLLASWGLLLFGYLMHVCYLWGC